MDVLIGNLAVEAGAEEYVSDKMMAVSSPIVAIGGKSLRRAA